jgi:hypothetical protein
MYEVLGAMGLGVENQLIVPHIPQIIWVWGMWTTPDH